MLFLSSIWLKIWQCFFHFLCCLVYRLLRFSTPLCLRNLLRFNFDFHSCCAPDIFYHDHPFLCIALLNSEPFFLTLPPSILVCCLLPSALPPSYLSLHNVAANYHQIIVNYQIFVILVTNIVLSHFICFNT